MTKINFKKLLSFLILLIIIVIPLIGLAHPELPVTHDGQDHVARIANFYKNLQEGIFIPRWAGNLNWGYGHPILMFLYPLPSYFTSLFHFLGFSLVDSLKVVFGLSFILSWFTMYLFVKNQFKNEYAGVIAGFLYVFAPYRFIDLYVRGAIGEHVAFIFPPLVLYFLLKCSKTNKTKYVFGGAIAFAGLILSHNAISLMFFPLLFLYILYLYFSLSKKMSFLFQAAIIIFMGFGISAFFWLPAFLEGKYTLRDIVTANEYASRFVSPTQFLFGDWNYGGSGQFTTQIGIVHWLFVILSIPVMVFSFIKKKRSWKLISFLLLIYFVVLFFMTEYSNFIWAKITILQKFQFPWRLLSVTVFITAVLGGYVFSLLKQKKTLALIAIIVLLLVFNKDYWYAKSYVQKSEEFYSGIYNGTTDTGESAPIWSVRFMEQRPKAVIQVIEGNAFIKVKERTSTIHIYNINVKKKARIRENTLYFPGWNVFANGEKIIPEFQDPANRGVITFYLPKGTHEVILRFSETKVRIVSNILSALSIAGLLIYYVYWRKKKGKK